ncbi:MAG: PorT family protein [Bacteroidales bacterium]|nr:PorT family protein [Bacteroidales bacterium]
MRFGVMFDPSYSWFVANQDNIESATGNAGLNGGLVIDNYFAENYAFSTGLSIATKSATLGYLDSLLVTINSKDQTLDKPQLQYRAQYIQLPVGLKFKTREFGYVTFFVQLGFTSGIKIKANKTDISAKTFEKADAMDDIKLFQLAYHVGGGIEYSLGGNTAIMAGLVFDNSFTDFFTDAGYNANLNTLALRAGLLF